MLAAFEIRSIAVLNREDARPPARLTVTYKGCYPLKRLQVPLALVPLNDGVHATRAAGKISLVQKFPAGRGPVFRTRIRGILTLELRLSTKWWLRARAWVSVDDLLSRTKQGLVKLPFDEKKGHKVEKAFVQVVQVSPDSNPGVQLVYPLRFLPPIEVSPYVTFPPQTGAPSAFHVKQLVDAMLGPLTDKTDWSKPFTFSPSTSTVKCPTPPPATDTHYRDSASSTSVSTTADTVQLRISEKVQPDAEPDLPQEDSGLAERRVKDDIPRPAPHCPALQQHQGTDSEDDSCYAPQASRQEVGYAYVKLWEYVFGEA